MSGNPVGLLTPSLIRVVGAQMPLAVAHSLSGGGSKSDGI